MPEREVKLVYKITDEGTIRTLDEIREDAGAGCISLVSARRNDPVGR